MDVLSGFKSDVFRTILIFVIPGLVGAAPFVFVLQAFYPGMLGFAEANPTLSTFLGAVTAVIVGMLSSELGSSIEATWIDARLAKKDPDFYSDWFRYLRSVMPDHLVAHSYIDDKVMYLYFELSMVVAFAICGVGNLVAGFVVDSYSLRWLALAIVGCGAGVVYFLHEAWLSARLLAKVRKEVLAGVGSGDHPIPPR